ncbi:MAG TPA: hypothetical protein VM737_04245 [Gemmatimonadota bacterium]|nr:hypothetical protein [Gemmatimonadota bacterium]
MVEGPRTGGSRFPPPRPSRLFVRNFRAYDHLQAFVVSAVSAILAIRLLLHLTGYPSIGGDALHIAHVLWGGLLMLAAMIVLLSFLSEATVRLAAILGGFGFGAFIDEVGKFVTRDSDYFYQPAVALMYVTFVLLLLAAHAIHGRREHSEQEYLLNALREMEELALHDLDEEEARRARRYLDRSDPHNPLAAALRTALTGVELVPLAGPLPIARARDALRRGYRRIARLPRFDQAVILVFVGQLAIKLAYGAILVFLVGLGWDRILDWRIVGRVAERIQDLTTAQIAQLAASALSGVFVLLGVVRILARRRLAAYRMFESAILVSILLVQVFSFYNEQFAALIELAFNLTMLIVLRSMIALEESRAAI